MLKDCIEILKKEIELYKKDYPNGDEISFITDSYSLTVGTYYLLDIETGNIKDSLEVDKNADKQTDLYRKFAKLEYLSMYLDSNKAVADKNIFSNNIYSFIVKKENIEEKITESIIDGYYSKILKFIENSDTDKRKLYIDYETKYGKTDNTLADKAKDKIKQFIKNLDVKNQKGRLAVFFDIDITEYKKESNRYILANIYNANKYNYSKNNAVFGLPNNNMGLNDKKPYLKNKSRKSNLPFAISQDDILFQKLFFDYLMNLFDNKKYYLYFTEDGVQAFGSKAYPQKDICGYFMRIMKAQKECEILEFLNVDKRNDKVSIKVDNILNIEYSDKIQQNLNYKKYTSLNELIPVISEILYSKWLESNYFTDAKDIKIKNDSGKLKNILLKTRKLWADWFYLGKQENLKNTFEKFSMEIIKNTIENFYIPKAREQYNLRMALIDYFNNKEKNMSEKIKTIVEVLDKKINSKINDEIENDEEYYFAVGQAANYFISKNKTTKKSHSLISPILQCRTNAKLKETLKRMFEKYAYAIQNNSLRFNNLYGMISRYEAKNEINFDMLIGGYLYQSLIYKKEEGEDNE